MDAVAAAAPEAEATHPTLVLALDIGSTSLKAALFHASRGCIGESSAPLIYRTGKQSGPAAAPVELDGEPIWQTVVSLIHNLCTAADISSMRIDRVAVTSQAQTFALLGEGDALLTPFISWMDTRGSVYLPILQAPLGDVFHQHCSFATAVPEMQLAKLLWFRHQQPALLDQAKCVISLSSYLLLRLAGICAIDPNLAAMSGLYSLRLQDWWPEALASCGLRRDQLPELAPLGRPLRARAHCSESPLRQTVEIVLAGNDQTAGAYGNDCHPDELVVTLGTALVAYRLAGETAGPYNPLGCWGPYPGGGYYELAVQSQGCSSLDWAVGQVTPGANVEAFLALAQTAPSGPRPSTCTEATCFYPDRMSTPAAWIGAGDRATRAVAVLEGIGFALRRLIAEDLGYGEHLDAAITVVGGGSRSSFWLQRLADILGCPISRGLADARIGAAALAVADTPAFVRPAYDRGTRQGSVLHPDPVRHRAYRRLYRDWLRHA